MTIEKPMSSTEATIQVDTFNDSKSDKSSTTIEEEIATEKFNIGNAEGNYNDIETSRSLNGSYVNEGEEENEAQQRLAQDETKAVNVSKVILLLVLVAVTALCSVTTYKYTTNQEEREFQIRFQDFADQIIEVVHLNSEHIRGTYATWSLQITTAALASNATWPYVTLPNFEAQAERAVQESTAEMVGVVPLIRDKLKWQEYAMKNLWWIEEGFDYVGYNETEAIANDSGMGRPPPSLKNVMPFIFRGPFPPIPVGNETIVEDLWAPFWQTAPVLRSSGATNLDSFGFPSVPTLFKRMRSTENQVLSLPLNEQQAFDYPASYMFTPIYDKIIGDDREIVGTLFARFPWIDFFKNLVPDGIQDITVVVRNECSENDQTYVVRGSTVEFVAEDDLHDTQYDECCEVVMDFDVFERVADECHPTVHIYPTEAFEQYYLSNKPIIYTVAAVIIFMVTALTFAVYDCLVQKRQDKVMDTAERSNAIVTSLFPEVVRDRLMDKAAPKEPAKHGMMSKFVEEKLSNKKNDNQLDDKASGPNLISIEEDGGILEDQVIADVFDDVSVLFADIAGFTAWSSNREASEVFQLLETIFNTFDGIAKRRKVFKVETIGDCYMAATGLPQPRRDHAVCMVKFARECLQRVGHILHELQGTLGPETLDLSLRFGIHSGSVTAGVLRGEKSRFQLFGDTVNTAARMESTGEKKRIQISQSTASLLVKGGRKRWIEARQDLVQAKGKGELQTYWVVCDAKSVSGETDGNSSCSEMVGLSSLDREGSVEGSDTSQSGSATTETCLVLSA